MDISKLIKVVTFIAILIVSSCNVDEDVQLLTAETDVFSNTLKLGRKLQNPYSVANMQLAWENLQSINPEFAKEQLKIEATHLYVKFKPQGRKELDLLKQKGDLDLYPFPLDYEIEIDGDRYRESGLKEEQPTPQYAAVPINFNFPPEVDYDVLSDLFIPDERSDHSKARFASDYLVDELVHEAMKITYNLSNEELNDKGAAQRTASSNWRPEGRVRIWDTNGGISERQVRVFSHWEYYPCPNGIALEGPEGGVDLIGSEQCRRAVYTTQYEYSSGAFRGVKDLEVKARRWFTTHKGKTDNNGRFSCDGTFKNEARYLIYWEKHDFSILDDGKDVAFDESASRKGFWAIDYGRFNESIVKDKHQYFATAFMAAQRYYHEDIHGLRRPPQAQPFQPRMNIAAYFENGISNHSQETRLLGEWIKLRAFESSTRAIYSTTLHELGHASHWDISTWHYNNCDDLLKESWADAVAVFLTADHYGWDISDIRVVPTALRQHQTLSDMRDRHDENKLEYTTALIDLIDDYDQSTESISYPKDRVSGYTLAEVERALSNITERHHLISNLKNFYNNSTEIYLEELLDFYE